MPQVALIEVLQKRKLRNNLRPVNQHQMIENVTTALNAITDDGIKLVNIGILTMAVRSTSALESSFPTC